MTFREKLPDGTTKISGGHGGGGGGGIIEYLVPGTDIDIDASDPAHPIVSFDGTIPPATTVPPTQGAISESGSLVVSTGTKRAYNDTGATRTLLSIRATVDSAPVGGTVVIDVKINGISVFTSSPKPTIAAGAYTAKVTAIDVPGVIDGNYLTIDVVSTTFPAANLTVQWSWS